MKKIPKEKVEIIEKNLTQVLDILKMNGYDTCAAKLDDVAYDILEAIKVDENTPKED